MALGLATTAKQWGAQVEILLGPVSHEMQRAFERLEIKITPFISVSDYRQALPGLFSWCEDFFSLAAVLDFEVLSLSAKIEREKLRSELTLPIQPVEDFAAWAGQNKAPHQRVIAFAAEAGPDILARAERKRVLKHADFLVANPVLPGLGPESARNEIWLLGPHKDPLHFGPGLKHDLAAPLFHHLFERA